MTPEKLTHTVHYLGTEIKRLENNLPVDEDRLMELQKEFAGKWNQLVDEWAYGEIAGVPPTA